MSVNIESEKFLRIIDIPREEILDIEEYLKWLDIWREAIKEHVNFIHAIGDIDAPVRPWEFEVSACFRYE